ncbi:hypothetical protein MSG28_013808 [Choristoneura fumiferana]|uniref:Uncharacterized protein n=1 Tax=Choristoneura fumiferana TaxID=7141 RepID=A0ACC0K8Y0_CHOFU|nr:hypothetical protein MSG28_013808 [Choristoneura fumiferana]
MPYLSTSSSPENLSEFHIHKITVEKFPTNLTLVSSGWSSELIAWGRRPTPRGTDLEAAGAALASVLSDPASRQDIAGKLAAVGRQYENLQRKLDHRKAEIEAALKLLVSADKHKLQQQLERHEPLYRELTQREHELIMLLDKVLLQDNEVYLDMDFETKVALGSAI